MNITLYPDPRGHRGRAGAVMGASAQVNAKTAGARLRDRGRGLEELRPGYPSSPGAARREGIASDGSGGLEGLCPSPGSTRRGVRRPGGAD